MANPQSDGDEPLTAAEAQLNNVLDRRRNLIEERVEGWQSGLER